MQLLCALPLRVARKLRNRITPALLKASTTTQRAAASVRQSVRQSLYFHTSSTDSLKHHPRPAALGTVAMLGNVKASVATGMDAARGQGMRLRRQMSTIYRNWDQDNVLSHNTARLN
ncbi:hypothetical protein QQZ08_000064 [Neonectria magnoliae]|uniref:Uncharacterized protein n=1 Tax=Neonectria magnoliae TaxID=2732573 RepID=A0ABR1IHR4_9HYPO